MQTPFIVGQSIYLRPLCHQDLNDTYLGWLNDPVVTRYLESGIFPYTQDKLEQFYNEISSHPDEVMLAVVYRETDQHVGNVKLERINWVHRRATFGILIGEKQFWGRGIGTQATRMIVEYGFFRLNLRRIDLGVYAEHTTAVHIYERIGFQIEGRFREDLFHEGRYFDRLWMGLLRNEYRSLQGEIDP